MKNLNSVKYVFIALAIVFAFSSCEKESDNAQVELGSGTLKGKAWINLNYVNDVPEVNYDKVSAGTKIYAKINSSDLVTVPSKATYQDLILTTTVDTNGEYNFSIPANLKVVTVTLSSDDFRADVTETASKTTNEIFHLPTTSPYTETVRADEVKILDIYFAIK